MSGTVARRGRAGLAPSVIRCRPIPPPTPAKSLVAHVLRPLREPNEPPGDSATNKFSGLTGPIAARLRPVRPVLGDPTALMAGLPGTWRPPGKTCEALVVASAPAGGAGFNSGSSSCGVRPNRPRRRLVCAEPPSPPPLDPFWGVSPTNTEEAAARGFRMPPLEFPTWRRFGAGATVALEPGGGGGLLLPASPLTSTESATLSSSRAPLRRWRWSRGDWRILGAGEPSVAGGGG